jgi:hypothetical protein
MKPMRPNLSLQPWLVTLSLAGSSLGVGYLSHPEGPDWKRWLAVAVSQGILGSFGVWPPDSRRPALRRLILKTALWPAIVAGSVGAARWFGIEIYGHLPWLAVLALAAAHVLGEAIRPAPQLEKREGWLLDVQWILAIAGAPWICHVVSDAHMAEFLASGAIFLYCVPPSGVLRPFQRLTESPIPTPLAGVRVEQTPR